MLRYGLSSLGRLQERVLQRLLGCPTLSMVCNQQLLQQVQRQVDGFNVRASVLFRALFIRRRVHARIQALNEGLEWLTSALPQRRDIANEGPV